MKVISIRLPDVLHAKVIQTAEKTGSSVADCIRSMLTESFEKHSADTQHQQTRRDITEYLDRVFEKLSDSQSDISKKADAQLNALTVLFQKMGSVK